MMTRALFTLVLVLPLSAQAVELRGHGGPVRALAVSGDTALTGSFDTTAILWNAETGAAERVLRLHDGGVTAAAFFGDALATGGEDGRVALWRDGAPVEIARHGAPVAALAVSADGARMASAGWDGAVRVHGAEGETILEHGAPVNGAAFLPDGRLVTAAQDLTLRVWRVDGRLAASSQVAAPVSALAVAGDRIATAGADGAVRFFDAALAPLGVAQTDGGALVGLSAAADGARVAASSVTGRISVVDARAIAVERAIAEVGPVWSVAFADDGATLLAGGGDRVVRRWDVATGASLGRTDLTTPAPDAGLGDSRGAQVFRACAACHTLGPDDGHRAGPTLHGVFGRRIGTAEGYDYSEALRGMDIVWTPETVSALFDVGPTAYTPGTKMPEQRIGSAEDRAALMEFLSERTR